MPAMPVSPLAPTILLWQLRRGHSLRRHGRRSHAIYWTIDPEGKAHIPPKSAGLALETGGHVEVLIERPDYVTVFKLRSPA